VTQKRQTSLAMWGLASLALAALCAAPASAYGQFVGTVSFPGMIVDFYRVGASSGAGPQAGPMHPKWLRTEQRGLEAPQQLDPLLVEQPGLDEASSPELAPSTTGTLRAICLLVDFSDRTASATWTRQHYADMLFSEYPTYATGSMRDYYQEVSYGLLDVEGEVANGSGGAVTGWFRAPQTHVYYCNGVRGLGSYPQNAQKLVEDVVALAGPVVDFAPYASGGAGTMVDLLFVVHAGTSYQQSGLNTDLSTHKWQTISPVWVDGVYCSTYALEAEDDPIGGFAHEAGHVLGAPDLYDYDSGYINKWDDDDYPVREWCLMASGSWGGPAAASGTVPSHFCGYIKNLFGWLPSTQLTTADDNLTITVDALETTNGATSLYRVDLDAVEYLLLENRYPGAAGIRFDQHEQNNYTTETAKRGGIVIYHVDTREPSGSGRFNNGWPYNSNYAVWVEDPGMSPYPGYEGTYTNSPQYELKSSAAFRSDGVSRLDTNNAYNDASGLVHRLYPTARDNQYAASAVAWIDVLSPPGDTMDICVHFAVMPAETDWMDR